MLDEQDKAREQRARRVFEKFNQLRNGKYQIVTRVSSDGCFSSIYELKSTDGKKLIMKAVDTMYTDVRISPQEVIKYTEAEIDSMKKCKDSEYVMDLIDAFDAINDEATGDHVYLLIMPKLQPCDQYFEACDYNIVDIIKMAKDICKALKYCHARKILHRDVKEQNAYYDPDRKHFVLSDFGISRSVVDKSAAVTRIGSRLAPEILAFRPLNGLYNSDIFSLGITMLLLNARCSSVDLVIASCMSRLHTKIKETILMATEGDPTKRYQTATDFYNALCEAERIAVAASVNKPEIEKCVDAFMKKEYQKALDIARAGCQIGDRRMLYLCSYLLVSGGKADDGMNVLLPLLVSGDPVATGLYGIFGHMLKIEEKDEEADKEMIRLIDQSAQAGFSIAQYYVGRWYIENNFGFPKNTELGCELLFNSAIQGFRPAMYHFKKLIERNKIDSLVSFQPFLDIINIELEGYSEDNYPEDTVRVLANC